MHSSHLTLALADEAATLALGASIAATLRPGMVVWLEGDLGAGKTTLVRGLLRAAGEVGLVKSPSYTIVEVHTLSELNFYHFDFYRFNQAEEYLDAGLDEYFTAESICLVEWPDKAQPYVAAADLLISLSVAGDGREAHLDARTPKGIPCLAAAKS